MPSDDERASVPPVPENEDIPASSSDESDVECDSDELRRKRPNSTSSETSAQSKGKKRSRTITTPQQAAVLNMLLVKTPFPSTEMREEVGRSIGMSARRVQVWFQNRRQSQKRAKDRDVPDFTLNPITPTMSPPMGYSQKGSFRTIYPTSGSATSHVLSPASSTSSLSPNMQQPYPAYYPNYAPTNLRPISLSTVGSSSNVTLPPLSSVLSHVSSYEGPAQHPQHSPHSSHAGHPTHGPHAQEMHHHPYHMSTSSASSFASSSNSHYYHQPNYSSASSVYSMGPATPIQHPAYDKHSEQYKASRRETCPWEFPHTPSPPTQVHPNQVPRKEDACPWEYQDMPRDIKSDIKNIPHNHHYMPYPASSHHTYAGGHPQANRGGAPYPHAVYPTHEFYFRR